MLRVLISIGLCGLYVCYVAATLRASRALVTSGHGTQTESALFLTHLKLPLSTTTIIVQAVIAIVILLLGAQGFIHAVEGIAVILNITPLLLSLLLVPLATELPEKINSIRWIRRGKDTLAFGNITGAMVFQGSLLPAIGILLTPWTARREVLGGVCVTLAGALWLRIFARKSGVRAPLLAVNGFLYAAYLAFELTT
jgi:cation:H+ antiporter